MMAGEEQSVIRGLILDMDGVLWRDDQSIGDLPAIFEKISQCGWRVILATNNSTLSARQYLDKLAGFGVFLEEWQVVNSSQATALYLHQRFPQGGPVYVIGEEGLKQALSSQNFFISEEDPQAVVVGMDRQLTFERLVLATRLIRSGRPFIATNPDRTFPTPQGLIPGTGAILAALEAATDVKPLVIGKPETGMYAVALERMGLKPGETLVVGDRLETDIAGAQAMGCQTGLVLSGVTSEDHARAWKPAPDFIAEDLAHLLDMVWSGG